MAKNFGGGMDWQYVFQTVVSMVYLYAPSICNLG
jgi:hypothetical protein